MHPPVYARDQHRFVLMAPSWAAELARGAAHVAGVSVAENTVAKALHRAVAGACARALGQSPERKGTWVEQQVACGAMRPKVFACQS